MALEDVAVFKEKNRIRLRHVLASTFSLGVNVTAASRFKDSLRILTFILIIMGLVTCYGLVQYIIRYKENFALIVESACLSLQVLISVFKLSFIIFVQHRFSEAMRIVQSHELIERIRFLSYETPYNKQLRKDVIQILDNCWAIALRQFNFYMFACLGNVAYYLFRSIGVNTYHLIMGHTKYTNLLPYPALFPAWEDKVNEFPYYQIMAFVVVCANHITGLGALSFDGLFIIMSMHGVALFRVQKRIVNFTTFSEVPKELRVDYLRQCISQSELIYRFCANINELYMHIGLVQFILSLGILGMVMFQASMGLETDLVIFIRMVLYILAAGFQVVIYCLNGQFITNESDSLPNAWYECLWYDESMEFKMLIRMMILRTNRVIDMQASWFTTMSLPTLLAIAKTSASYFLLLRNLSE